MRAHAEHQPGDAVGLVDLQNAVGELDRFLDVAVGEHGQEGAARADRCCADRPAARRDSRRRGGGIALTRRRGGRPDSCRTARSSARNSRAGSARAAGHCADQVGGEMRRLRPRPHAGNMAKGSRLDRLHLADDAPPGAAALQQNGLFAVRPAITAPDWTCADRLKRLDKGSIVTPTRSHPAASAGVSRGRARRRL